MSLLTNPPHSISLYSVTSAREGGGGTALSYTLVQSGIPCSINSASASERLLFGQTGIVVDSTIGVVTSQFTSPPQRGWKVVDESNSRSYHVRGINDGQAYGGVPEITYLLCEAQI